jgi:hypothetical protein
MCILLKRKMKRNENISEREGRKKKERKGTMCEMLGVEMTRAVGIYSVHIEKLCEELHCRLCSDIDGFHE